MTPAREASLDPGVRYARDRYRVRSEPCGDGILRIWLEERTAQERAAAKRARKAIRAQCRGGLSAYARANGDGALVRPAPRTARTFVPFDDVTIFDDAAIPSAEGTVAGRVVRMPRAVQPPPRPRSRAAMPRKSGAR